MFDDTDDWPSGVPVAGTFLVTSLVLASVTRDDEALVVWWDGPRVVVLARWP